MSGVMPVNPVTSDIVQGYFQPATDITVNACIVNPASITPNGFTVSWAIRPADIPNVQFVRVLVPGQSALVVENSAVNSQVVTGLYPGSTYQVSVLFYSNSGAITSFALDVTTLPDPTDTNPIPPSRRRGKLIGQTW